MKTTWSILCLKKSLGMY